MKQGGTPTKLVNEANGNDHVKLTSLTILVISQPGALFQGPDMHW